MADASNLVGSVTELAWSPDGYTLAVAWANCGWALWSVFGGLLHTSLGERIGLADRVRLSHLAWSASGYHLLGFLSFEPSKSYGPSVPADKIVMADPHSVSTHQHLVSSTERDKTAQNVLLQDAHLAIFHIARSSLTVNPTLDNHSHVLLQTEDRVIFASHDQLNDTRAPQTLLLPQLYIKHNWPLRFVAVSTDGERIVVSGSHGFAHYNFSTKRWSVFGNEVQERSMQVYGGIVWWKHFICCCCYSLNHDEYEVRVYPSDQRLDNQFSSVHRVSTMTEPLLVDCLGNLFTLLTSNGRVQILRLSHSQRTARKAHSLDTANHLHRSRPTDSSVSDLAETCAVDLPDLTTSPLLSSRSESDLSSREVRPRSLLVNYAGYLFLLQSSVAPDSGLCDPASPVGKTSRKPLILTPFLIASNVELVWSAVGETLTATNPHYLGGFWHDPLTRNPGVTSHSSFCERALLPYLNESLWLYCGSTGLQIWLPLPKFHPANSKPPDANVSDHRTSLSPVFSLNDPSNGTYPFAIAALHSPGYVSRRIMLSVSLEENTYPLTILFHQAVLVSILNEFQRPLGISRGKVSASTFGDRFYSILPCGVLQLEFKNVYARFYVQVYHTNVLLCLTCFCFAQTHAFLHRIIQQLLRKNLGAHALQLASAYQTLPYFHRLLEWLLHEVLEAEATSKSPIPDPLLPQVVAFIQEFPHFLEIVAQCARKTEIARWPHLFTAVGRRPIDLFELCVECGNLEAAASYLIILQSSESVTASQHCTLQLIELAIDSARWQLLRELVRFLRAIDPCDLRSSSAMTLEASYRSDLYEPLPSIRRHTDKKLQTRSSSLSETGESLPPTASVEVGSTRKVSRGSKAESQTTTPSLSLVERIDQLVAQKFTALFARGQLKRMAELAANFPEALSTTTDPICDSLAHRIRIQKFDLHRVTDWPVSLLQLHDSFGYPLPSVAQTTDFLEQRRTARSDPKNQSTHLLHTHSSSDSFRPTPTSSCVVRQLRYLLSQLLQGGSYEWACLVALIVRDSVGLFHAVTLAIDVATKSTLSRLKDRHATPTQPARLWRRMVGSHTTERSQPSLTDGDVELAEPCSPVFGDPLSRVFAGLKQVDDWAVEHCPAYHLFLESLQLELDQLVGQASSFFGHCASGSMAGEDLNMNPKDKASTHKSDGISSVAMRQTSRQNSGNVRLGSFENVTHGAATGTLTAQLCEQVQNVQLVNCTEPSDVDLVAQSEVESIVSADISTSTEIPSPGVVEQTDGCDSTSSNGIRSILDVGELNIVQVSNHAGRWQRELIKNDWWKNSMNSYATVSFIQPDSQYSFSQTERTADNINASDHLIDGTKRLPLQDIDSFHGSCILS
ncbi:RAB6A-GEF complex partner protein 1 [Paragonimus westermani]|uniref:Protein RIC1 homolog n=1 Tax=Paragonimus westermani TaxID=34504 RepID=A0A5J4NJN1_9TREM|nr:RAB6A-GEF complex partner protein 1 [Paragonimus westermani]